MADRLNSTALVMGMDKISKPKDGISSDANTTHSNTVDANITPNNESNLPGSRRSYWQRMALIQTKYANPKPWWFLALFPFRLVIFPAVYVYYSLLSLLFLQTRIIERGSESLDSKVSLSKYADITTESGQELWEAFKYSGYHFYLSRSLSSSLSLRIILVSLLVSCLCVLHILQGWKLTSESWRYQYCSFYWWYLWYALGMFTFSCD